MITDERSLNILDRDILGKLQLNWKDIFNSFATSEVSSTSDNVTLNKNISKYKVALSDELVALKDFQADIPIDPQVFPKYFCARPVPYSLKEKVKHELERLVKLRIYHSVASSKWAVVIVPAFKYCVPAVFEFASIINRLLLRQPIVTNTISQESKIFLLH